MLIRGITSLLWLQLLCWVCAVQTLAWNGFKRFPAGAPHEGEVRLVRGVRPSEGRVEVFHAGKWGTVCDDSWELPEASVVCRQLGFPGAKAAVAGGTYGEGSGEIWLDDMDCRGTEKSLSTCNFKGWAVTDCSHKEDAGVVCERASHSASGLSDVHSPSTLDHSLGLSEDLGELFDGGELCDFSVVLRAEDADGDGKADEEEQTVCVHKLLLSRYPHFNITAESSALPLSVSHSCRPHVSSFLRYLYTRTIAVTISSAQCLHQLASHFRLEQLMQDVGRLFTVLLPEDETFHTQLAMYEYSVQTGDWILQENILQYLAWNCEALIESPAWKDLSVEGLGDLLARSDLVVPSESFLLKALEGWLLSRANSSNLEMPVSLLARIRFPMIPADELYELQFTSDLYENYKDTYLAGILKGFQFNALPVGTLRRHTANTTEEFLPRIYTNSPWSLALNFSSQSAAHLIYQYNQRHYQQHRSESFRTPVHNSAIHKDNTISWYPNIFQNQYECSNQGLRCDSLPTARLMSQDSFSNYQRTIRFNNRLLLSCDGRYVFNVLEFKNNMAAIANSSLTYPCPTKKHSYRFVVRPEYI